MKFDKNKAFPYPVLRPYCDDYVDVEFQTNVYYDVSNEIVVANITFVTSSNELIDQVKIGNAIYVAILSCRDTYFRSVLTSTESKFKKSFDAGNLRGAVLVDNYIIAIKNIPEFKSPDINPEFGKEAFSFSPGDVLAQDETQLFYFERDLFKPMSSVVDLVQNEFLVDGEWQVGLDDNHIQIEVSPRMKESIDNARNDKAKRVVLLNSIYFSAITYALEMLKKDEDAYRNQRWADIIKKKLHNLGWDLSHDAYILAQRLMKHPLNILDTYVLKGKDQ